MDHFDPQNAANENNEPVQIVDLDAKGSRQRKRAEIILTALHQSFAKPWRSYTLFSIILLILFSIIFLEYHWPLARTSSLPISTPTSPTPTASPTPTVSPPALVQLQHRPLLIHSVTPGASCPTTPEKQTDTTYGIAQGDGPVYVTIGTDAVTSPAIFRYAGASYLATGIGPPGWGGGMVVWFVNPGYQGLVLVRGRQVDGPHGMRFNDNAGGQHSSQQLVLNTMQGGSPWPNFATYTLLQAPGCYAYQVDGANFSYVIVFRAIVLN